MRAQLARFGMRFGLCFQLADDVLDLSGPPQELGRQPGSDVRDGVYTLPILHALHHPSPNARRLRHVLLRLQHARQPSLVTRARSLVRREWGRALLMRWLDMAHAVIPPMTADNESARKSLVALIDQIHSSATAGRSTSTRAARLHLAPDGLVA
jgi:heptaprenyl diphosphate synthase